MDETSIGSALKPAYSRCDLGKRCIITTSNPFVYRKFTLLVAINNKKCIAKELYEKGGMTRERLLEFLQEHIFPKYKNNLIVIDNASSHNNRLIKNAIIQSGNDYLFSVPYTPKTNAIEQYFNQIKTYLKKHRNVDGQGRARGREGRWTFNPTVDRQPGLRRTSLAEQQGAPEL